MYIENINSPADVKKLNIMQLNVLAEEMRHALLTRASRHGGHFGPNFGMVEAIIAMHYVFDSPKDKIVFDVSHQCYPHKMLTGRKDAYLYEEHYDDVSGYTNPDESEHDFFTVGHTSTSISLACGLAKARDLNGEDGNVIAVIGDGSLSGGEALEGLDFASELNGNMIIVANDNDMSIAENHGGLYANLKLLRETNGTAKLTAMQSVFPSVTKFGMAALLPHDELTINDDMKILCDGLPTESTENRDKILKRCSPKNCAITYENLLSMNQTQRRELVSGAEVVYIYHNKIDAVGDKANTEKQVFEACTDSVEEMKNLVRMVVNSMSGSNIIITADHGFLYSNEPLSESDKAETSLVSGNISETGRRYIIADKNSSSDILMKIPMDEYSESIRGFAPYENIRIKKQGGGMNFVHGGISLQECCVPVIIFKNISKNSKKFVDIKKVTLRLISMTRKISNNIFSLDFMQPEAVGGKIVPATYEIYLCDKQSVPVSDVQTVTADKTGEPQDRVFKIRFTLKSADFDGNAVYYLNVVDKEAGTIIERTEFSVKIAFANDFDF